MRVCSIQPAMSATVEENTATVEAWMQRAASHEAELIVFPEMMLTGYDQHLHEFFKEPDWYGQIETSLEELSMVTQEIGVYTLVGSPFLSKRGFLNALLLLQPGEGPVLAGSRTFLIEAWKKLWGFVESEERSPVDIHGILFGSVFCAESSFLDHVVGRGLEDSDVILCPSVATSKRNQDGEITRDGCGEGAKAITGLFKVPVIQSNYVSQVTPIPEGRVLGGSVVCDTARRIIQRASLNEQEMLFCDVTNDHGVVSVSAVEIISFPN